MKNKKRNASRFSPPRHKHTELPSYLPKLVNDIWFVQLNTDIVKIFTADFRHYFRLHSAIHRVEAMRLKYSPSPLSFPSILYIRSIIVATGVRLFDATPC